MRTFQTFAAGAPMAALEGLCWGLTHFIVRDEDGGVTGIYPVTAIMKRQTASVPHLTLENANGEISVLGVTAEHPLFETEAR